MKKVSRNFALGEPIGDIRELARLSSEKKSVVWMPRYGKYFIRPASFFLGWQLRVVMNARLFYSVKIEK